MDVTENAYSVENMLFFVYRKSHIKCMKKAIRRCIGNDKGCLLYIKCNCQYHI